MGKNCSVISVKESAAFDECSPGDPDENGAGAFCGWGEYAQSKAVFAQNGDVAGAGAAAVLAAGVAAGLGFVFQALADRAALLSGESLWGQIMIAASSSDSDSFVALPNRAAVAYFMPFTAIIAIKVAFFAVNVKSI